ncbi:hypothetical protein ACFRH6_09285 [Streptomyces sp. NPDC056749]|uniref:hypothetical protein n=1 Tax=Streptomyces sp. NPDC056749 TaxID=3345936 RepID=UPI0036B1E45C
MEIDQQNMNDAEAKTLYKAVHLLGVLCDFYVKTIESPETPEDRHFMESAASEKARAFAYDLIDRLKKEELFIIR